MAHPCSHGWSISREWEAIGKEVGRPLRRTISFKNCFKLAIIYLVHYLLALHFPSNPLQNPASFENVVYNLAQYPRRRIPFWSRPVDVNWNYEPSDRYIISGMCNKSQCVYLSTAINGRHNTSCSCVFQIVPLPTVYSLLWLLQMNAL
jgi:hypothetical protein